MNLHEAAEAGDLATMAAILTDCPSALNDCTGAGGPLHLAAAAGRREACAWLLDRGAAIEGLCGNNRSTPLHHAVKHNRLEVVRLLLHRGANPNARDENGVSPLLIAAHCGNHVFNPEPKTWLREEMDLLQHLIERGADANLAATSGYSPLHAAAFYGHFDPVRALLRANADRYAKNQEGRTARDLAYENQRWKVAMFLDWAKDVDDGRCVPLDAAGADPHGAGALALFASLEDSSIRLGDLQVYSPRAEYEWGSGGSYLYDRTVHGFLAISIPYLNSQIADGLSLRLELAVAWSPPGREPRWQVKWSICPVGPDNEPQEDHWTADNGFLEASDLPDCLKCIADATYELAIRAT